MKKICLLVLATIIAFPIYAQWTFVGSAFPFAAVRAVYFPDVNTGYAVGGDNVTGYFSKTTDGGVTWSYTSTTESALLRSIDFLSADTGFVCGAGGKLFKTTDAGTTWTSIYTNSSQYFRAVDFISPSVGLMAGAAGTILKSTDGGITWNTISLGITSDVIQLHMASATVGYACASGGTVPYANGYVFKTTDGGSSWTQVYFNATEGLLGLAVVNENIVYAGGNDQLIIKTTNGGTSWDVVHTGTLNHAIRGAFAIDANNVYTVDDGYYPNEIPSILHTTNGGATWNDTGIDTLTNAYFSIYFPTPTVGYTGDILGNIYRTTSCSVPTGLFTTNITATKAKLNWTPVADAAYYVIRYRQAGSSEWTFKKVVGTSSSKVISGLNPETDYYWKMKSICGGGSSDWSSKVHFTTSSLKASLQENAVDFRVYPNPAAGSFYISLHVPESETANVGIFDISGLKVHQFEVTLNAGNNELPIECTDLVPGVYFIKVFSTNNTLIQKIEIIK